MKKNRMHSSIRKDVHPDSYQLLESYIDHEYNFFGSVQFEAVQFIGRTFFKRKPKLGSGKNYLNISCGEALYDGWINADCYTRSAFFKSDNIWRVDARYLPLDIPSNALDGIYTEHTLEHLKARHVLNLLCEFYRTLKPGGTLRVALPCCQLTVDYYNGTMDPERAKEYRLTWPTGAEAIRGLTQYIGHESTWNAELLTRYLRMAGFDNISEKECGVGSDPELTKDNPERKWNSFYMEAVK